MLSRVASSAGDEEPGGRQAVWQQGDEEPGGRQQYGNGCVHRTKCGTAVAEQSADSKPRHLPWRGSCQAAPARRRRLQGGAVRCSAGLQVAGTPS